MDEDGTVRLNKEAYIGMAQLLLSGFTNIKWVRSGIRQEGDRVIMTGHFEGKTTGDLDLTSLGAGIIPASGKMIVWPEASLAYKVEGEKIVKEITYGEGSGVDALLEPLGVKLPST